jgi:hypothetical protein
MDLIETREKSLSLLNNGFDRDREKSLSLLKNGFGRKCEYFGRKCEYCLTEASAILVTLKQLSNGMT